MPIYEYRCEACGHTFDQLQKLADAPLSDCPECHAASLRRLISAPAFRLKGSGWYETDFKTDKEKKRNLADRPEGKQKEKTEKSPAESTDKSSKKKKSTEKSATGSGSEAA
jgi:putative FmdB family regulatory protein